MLYHLGRDEYRRLRTVILVSGGLGLVVFGLFPVAPPRLAAVGLQDTVALHAATYHSIVVPSLRAAVLAGLFAVLALMSGELTALSLLLVTIVVLWFETTVRDAWRGTHHPTTA